METWVMDLIEQYGYFGVFFLIAIENIFPPIPSEVILTFGGYMTSKTHLTVTGVIISSTIGSVFGAVLLYLLGNLLDSNKFEKIINRHGRWLRLKKEDLYRANVWFNKYGMWTVFLCRFIPLIRSLISIPAGMAKMNFSMFLLFTTLGTIIWNTILIQLGASVGENWDAITGKVDNVSNIIYGILGSVLVFIIFRYFKKHSKWKKV
jgi:membrane protein DedA with SNARE-associated domain